MIKRHNAGYAPSMCQILHHRPLSVKAKTSRGGGPRAARGGAAPHIGPYLTPPPLARHAHYEPRRRQASGAGLDSQRPSVLLVVKGDIPQNRLAPVFSLWATPAFPGTCGGYRQAKAAGAYAPRYPYKCVSP